MFRGDPVEFGPGGKPAFAQARDEDLLDPDPTPFLEKGGPFRDVIENVRDGLHLGDGVVELVHRGAAGVHVRIDQPGEDGFSGEVDRPGLRPGQPSDFGMGPHRHDPIPANRESLGNREAGIDRDDLAVGHHQVGSTGRLTVKEGRENKDGGEK